MLPSRTSAVYCEGGACRLSGGSVTTTGRSSSQDEPMPQPPCRESQQRRSYSQLPKFLSRYLPFVVDSAHHPVPASLFEDKLVGVYFTASWCQPCRVFSPQLATFADRHRDKFIVVVVSLDHHDATLKTYLKKYPLFYAVPFKHQQSYLRLAEKLEIQTLPTLLVCQANTGRPISACGVEAVRSNPCGCIDAWQRGRSGVRWWCWLKCW
ncbi:hypothetical protein H4R35_004518 [Dimargaris xerosporica]|nr:hypothetical protein H4R35_004518 [Dimargaris xerosporica]